MEKNSPKKSPSSSSSFSSTSSIAELFGPKDSLPSSNYSHSSSSSSASIFSSVFGPSSMGGGRDSTSHAGSFNHGAPVSENWSKYNKETTEQQCSFSSSILYGGQEVYSPAPPNHSQPTFNKKDDLQDDNPDFASRGNWWQGSLYY